MGYACPVCEVPHADAEHLANHLAFTAMLHSDEHEDWLDDHAPDWEASNPTELGPVVAEHVEETEFDGVFDDTTHQHDHDHGHGRFEDVVAEQAGRGAGGRGDLTGEQADVLREARELTRQMHESDEDGEEEDAADSSDTENE